MELNNLLDKFNKRTENNCNKNSKKYNTDLLLDKFNKRKKNIHSMTINFKDKATFILNVEIGGK